jgi:predicted transcriptional regulator
MKQKTLTIKFQNWDEFKKKVTKAFKDQKQSIAPMDIIVFSSVTEYQKFMTEQKLAILAVVANKKPKSIYQLAQWVDRDFANVQRDCVALDSHGFLRLEDAGDAKKSKIPKLTFNYMKIIVQMPTVSYSHNFHDAA